MLEIKVDVSSALEGLDRMAEDIHTAWDLAIREVTTAIVLPSLRAAILAEFPSGTGRTSSQLQSKFWFNKKTGLTASSVRVRGDRAFVMHIHEFGAKSHGGRGAKRKTPQGAPGDRGPLRARHVFGDAWRAMQSAVETAFVQSFERHLDIKLKASGF